MKLIVTRHTRKVLRYLSQIHGIKYEQVLTIYRDYNQSIDNVKQVLILKSK